MLTASTLLLAGAAALTGAPAYAESQADTHRPTRTISIKIKIVAFNDYHGNLESPGTFGVNTLVPAAQRPDVGGAEYLAAYVARMKAANRNTVVVGAGDFIGATPLVSALFFDEPAVETLNRIGVDFIGVGNHEFDNGKDELRRLQQGGCKSTDGGQPDANSCKGFGSSAPGTSANAFGRVLTEIDITLERDRPRHHRRLLDWLLKRNGYDVVAVSPINVLVARNNKVDPADPAIAAIEAHIAQNPEVRNVVAAYKTAVSPLANAVIAGITAPMSNTANAAGEMEAGALIADAQLQATQPASVGGAQIAFMNAGGVRNPGFVAPTGGSYPYAVTYGNAFTVQPFGNSLVTMTLTQQQIKDLLEQQFSGCNGQIANRIMQISASLAYTWDNAGSCGTRIRQVAYTPVDLASGLPVIGGPTENLVIDGAVQNAGKTYRVTVNNFMATGGDAFTVLLGGTNVLGGAQDIDALVAYFAPFKPPAAPYDPANAVLRKPRITRLN